VQAVVQSGNRQHTETQPGSDSPVPAGTWCKQRTESALENYYLAQPYQGVGQGQPDQRCVLVLLQPGNTGNISLAMHHLLENPQSLKLASIICYLISTAKTPAVMQSTQAGVVDIVTPVTIQPTGTISAVSLPCPAVVSADPSKPGICNKNAIHLQARHLGYLLPRSHRHQVHTPVLAGLHCAR
jgi:hypothetical protein